MSEIDLMRCATQWANLDIKQQLAALRDSKHQAETDWFRRATDMIPRPWNYLREQHWTRARASPERKAMTKHEERQLRTDQALDNYFKQKGIS